MKAAGIFEEIAFMKESSGRPKTPGREGSPARIPPDSRDRTAFSELTARGEPVVPPSAIGVASRRPILDPGQSGAEPRRVRRPADGLRPRSTRSRAFRAQIAFELRGIRRPDGIVDHFQGDETAPAFDEPAFVIP